MHRPAFSLPLLSVKEKRKKFVSNRLFGSMKRAAAVIRTDTLSKLLKHSREDKREGSTDNYKGSIGPEAKINYYESYKKLPMITERNEFVKAENSPNIAYLKQISCKNLNPQPLGIVRSKGTESSLDIHGLSIGDNYALALSEGLTVIKGIEYANLTNNRLTEKGARSLLTQLSTKDLKALNLSENRLGARSVELICSMLSKVDSKLTKLNLENINTNERNIVNLLKSICKSNSLKQLNLAKNSLTLTSAILIKDLLATNTSLVRLDLHWNNFNSLSGVVIFEGLQKNTTLHELDLSWNSLGNNHIEDKITQISKILSLQNTLMHLDLSYNYLTIQESMIFGEALNSNHSLLGLHMEGNCCTIDLNGFLIPQPIKMGKENGLLFRRVFNQKKTTDNCWICGKFAETQLIFKLNSPTPVYIHFDCEEFSPYLLMSHGDLFKITRALPPRQIGFYLSTGGKIFLATEYQVVDLPKPLMVSGDTEVSSIHKLNIIKPKGSPLDMKTPFKTKPRHREQIRTEQREERIIWSIENSIFKDYVSDHSQLMNDCFEFDWSLSRIENFIKNIEDRKKTKKFLKSIYKVLRLSFKSLSSFSGTEIFGIGSNTLTDFLYNCQAIDQLYLINDFGVNWNSTNVPQFKDQIYNPGNILVRYEFMEILVRIAHDRFTRNKICADTSSAIEKFTNEHILPNISDYKHNTTSTMNSNWWREEVYFCEDVDLVLKAFKPVLDSMYFKYSGRKTLAGGKKFMCIEEFNDFCRDGNLLNDMISNREVNFCFVQAMSTEVDEYYKKRHFEMSFVEFLEAFSRVCDMRDNDIHKRVATKVEEALRSLVSLCSRHLIDNFVMPTEETYHSLKYRIIA